MVEKDAGAVHFRHALLSSGRKRLFAAIGWSLVIRKVLGQGYRYHFLIVNSALMAFLNGHEEGGEPPLHGFWDCNGQWVNEHAAIGNRSINDVSSDLVLSPFVPTTRATFFALDHDNLLY